MKEFNRTSLPEEIIYNGKTYKYWQSTRSIPFEEFQKAAKEGLIKVNVLARRLRDATDLHGNKYKPSSFYFKKSINQNETQTA